MQKLPKHIQKYEKEKVNANGFMVPQTVSGGAVRESNPPEGFFTPHNGFEDRTAHQDGSGSVSALSIVAGDRRGTGTVLSLETTKVAITNR